MRIRAAILMMVLSGCAVNIDGAETCVGEPVTEHYFQTFDDDDLYYPRSSKRIFDIYRGKIKPRHDLDGVVGTIWVGANYTPEELQCWSDQGDKLASYWLGTRETAVVEQSSLGLFYLKRAAKTDTGTCDDPLAALRLGADEAGECYNKHGHFSPLSSGVTQAHGSLAMCYLSIECDLNPQLASYHQAKELSLGGYGSMDLLGR